MTHPVYEQPSLDDPAKRWQLLEQARLLISEQAKLEEGPMLSGSNGVTFGYLMRVLTERSLDTWEDERGQMRSKLTQEERGMMCDFWAVEYPVLADDLHAVAEQYSRQLTPEGRD